MPADQPCMFPLTVPTISFLSLMPVGWRFRYPLGPADTVKGESRVLTSLLGTACSVFLVLGEDRGRAPHRAPLTPAVGAGSGALTRTTMFSLTDVGDIGGSASSHSPGLLGVGRSSVTLSPIYCWSLTQAGKLLPKQFSVVRHSIFWSFD